MSENLEVLSITKLKNMIDDVQNELDELMTECIEDGRSGYRDYFFVDLQERIMMLRQAIINKAVSTMLRISDDGLEISAKLVEFMYNDEIKVMAGRDE